MAGAPEPLSPGEALARRPLSICLLSWSFLLPCRLLPRKAAVPELCRPPRVAAPRAWQRCPPSGHPAEAAEDTSSCWACLGVKNPCRLSQAMASQPTLEPDTLRETWVPSWARKGLKGQEKDERMGARALLQKKLAWCLDN